VTNLY